MKRRILVGVDGGGTKTNFLAVDADTGQQVATATAGSIHLYTMGAEVATEQFRLGLGRLSLGEEDTLIALAVGDPAIDDSTVDAGEMLHRELVDRGICSPELPYFGKSDVFMALYAFSYGAPSGLMISGTGSMGVALKESYRHGVFNEVITVGGWGDPTPDPGSGYSIAAYGIRAAMDGFDQIAPPTALSKAAVDFFGAKASRELADIFAGGRLTRSEIAAFSVKVEEVAESGDTVACELLRNAGIVLGKYACSMLRRIESEQPRLGIYGSVLVRNKRVRKAFDETVYASFPHVKAEIPQHPPEYGAVRYAADALLIQLSD